MFDIIFKFHLLLYENYFYSKRMALIGFIFEINIVGTINIRVETTHYTNLKHFASATPGIENGAMLYDLSLIHI